MLRIFLLLGCMCGIIVSYRRALRKDQRIEELEALLGTIRDAANIHLGSKQ